MANDNMYFLSKNVKVYPTSRRGLYTQPNEDQKTFDPEARLETEYNKVNLYGKTPTKPSYLISWNNNILKCIVGGYYFEINTEGETVKQYLFINTADVTLVNNNIDARTSKILKNIKDADTSALDKDVDGTYYFYGIATTDTYPDSLTADYVLQLKDATGAINPDAYLTSSIVRTTNYKGSLNTAYQVFEASQNKLLSNVNVGEYSYVFGENIKNYGNNNLIIGKNNTVGTNPENKDNNNIIIGQNITNKYDNNIVIGKAVTTTSNNQILIGDFTEKTIASDDQLRLFDTLTLKNNGVLTIKNTVTGADNDVLILKDKNNDNILSVKQNTVIGTRLGIEAANITISGVSHLNGPVQANKGLTVTTNDTTTALTVTHGINTDTLTATGKVTLSSDLDCSLISSSGNITTETGTITGKSIKLQDNKVQLGVITGQATIYGSTFTDSEAKLANTVNIGSSGASIQYNNQKGCLEIIC